MVDIYLCFGTIPCLYAEINSLKQTQNFSYMWLRRGFVDLSDKKNIKKVRYINNLDKDFLQKEMYEIIDFFKKDKKENIYNIYTDDSRIQFMLKIIFEAKIEKRIKQFNIISEGNITQQFYDELSENYKKKLIDDIKTIKNLKTNSIINELLEIKPYAYCMLEDQKVKYLIPCLDKMKEIDSFFRKKNFIELDLETIFNDLNDNYKSKYLELYKNKEIYNEKEALIIIGSYKLGRTIINNEIYKQLVLSYINSNHNKKIYFKPHPLYFFDEKDNFYDFLNQKNVEIISSNIPIEIILWTNKNIKIGGFGSTTNVLVDINRTVSIIGEKIGFLKHFEFKSTEIKLSQNIIAALSQDYYKFYEDMALIKEEGLLNNQNITMLINQKEEIYLKLINEKEANLINLINEKEANLINLINKNKKNKGFWRKK